MEKLTPAAKRFQATGRSAIVLGGTGFIGSTLVEILAHAGISTTVVAHRWSSAARVSKFPVRVVQGDIGDRSFLERTIVDPDTVVFALAFDSEHPSANIEGAGILAEVCHSAGAALIYVSTMSVFEPLARPLVTDGADYPSDGGVYAETKRAAERRLLAIAKDLQGLRLAVVQPTIVYGPFGGAWTDGTVREILKGVVVLPNQGRGVCNLIHVDDVCAALLHIGGGDRWSNEPALLTGPDTISWGEYYLAHATALGLPERIVVAPDEWRRQRVSPGARVKRLLGDPRLLLSFPPLKRLAKKVAQRLPGSAKTWLKQTYAVYQRVAPAPITVHSGPKGALLASPCVIEATKIKTFYDFEPTLSAQAGLANTRMYVRWAAVENDIEHWATSSSNGST